MTATPLTLHNAPDAALVDLAAAFEDQMARARSLGDAIRIRRNLDRIAAEQSRRATERVA